MPLAASAGNRTRAGTCAASTVRITSKGYAYRGRGACDRTADERERVGASRSAAAIDDELT